MTHKDGKWAKKILDLQLDDGSWGYFHSLSTLTPGRFPSMTTEQALRRLEILGYTIDDKPVRKAVGYMNDCLMKKIKIPDREEKTHNWNIYTELMLSTWIRIFTPENRAANNAAAKWRKMISAAFKTGLYDHSEYITAYEKIFGIKMNPKAGRLVDFVHFYPISLLTNFLDKRIEARYFQYILEHDSGMYYIYSNKLKNVPETFQSKNTGSYLRAIELLSKYNNPECKKQLQFVVKWLKGNMLANNEWDMGKEAKDGINFPLSDSWKTDRLRIEDCTYRINKIVKSLENQVL
ncbi:MAG: hypothetical protein LBQ94_09480 [Treponema sp.]|jgi:hypothetical protein|nr:hypothetical protein [Treponema sp.]